MDVIDSAFTSGAHWLQAHLPEGILTQLITEGLIPGVGGVCTFIPQIALLFFFLSILEESGYMSRAVFIMDRLVRPFGLNGKSVVPLMSSVACAIPGVMSARTISQGKDRLITILVAPLMSCSARIPVYTLLIALVIPQTYWGGWLDLQGLVLLGLYALGLVMALCVSWWMKRILKSAQPGFMVMEIPPLQPPLWRQVFQTMWEKVRIFVWDAGKVIVALSIIIWAMASFGPSERRARAVQAVESTWNGTEEEKEKTLAAVNLENSYIGIMGKTIEPVIAPMGFEWKIGISIITSFAAREVFVGSLATIYAVGEEVDNNERLIDKMKNDRRLDNGEPVYTLASGSALLVFYAFAMQCLATFAVVYRETQSWKWPMIQLVYMGVLAYVGAWITFILLN
jgi:ferrous iron transport protein B